MRGVDEMPEICKNCKRNGVIEVWDNNLTLYSLEQCTYKDTIKELIGIADGDVSLKIRCGFKEVK